jgi:predicted O-methyltransferase YrrM
LAAEARKNVSSNPCEIRIAEGNIDTILVPEIQQLNTLDFVFFDANHRAEPTLRYFENCLAKVHENTVFVFDDIYWSEEMESAWQQICADPRVMLSIDLFWLGLVFFRKAQPKQHFKLRF